jgi:uncharacterized protein (DUF58 family)
MARADASEFGLTMEIPAGSWFRQPPPRAVDTSRIVRASYRSVAGRSLAGFGIVSGIALLVVAWFAREQEPGSAILLLGFALFCVLMILLPVLPARRLAHALRDGVVSAGTVTNVEIEPVGTRRTIDSIANGLARGRLRVPGLADDGVEFESDAPWATRIAEGSRMDVLVDPERRRVLWILGPAADDAP